MWRLSVDPFFSDPVMIGLTLLAVVAIAATLIRQARGKPFRVLAIALLLSTLFNPALIREERRPVESVAAIIVDRSVSQQFGNRTEQTDSALSQLQERLAAFNDLAVRVIETNGDADRDGTQLFTRLATELADVPAGRFAGAFLITDGQVHDVPGSIEQLGLDGPFHGLITGSESEFDRRIHIEQAPLFGIVGAEQDIIFKVLEEGPDASRAPVAVIVSRNGEIIEVINAIPGEETVVAVEVPNRGPSIFELEAGQAGNEITHLNNRAVVTIEGVRDHLRVLLVSGEPHPGERTWRNLLKSDASVDLVHFTILRPPDKLDSTPINQLSLIAFPTRELFSLKIDEFDLIIFDRYQRRGVLPMLYFDNIATYVENGGAVLLAAGPEYTGVGSLYQTHLSRILPAEPTGFVYEAPFTPMVSDTGRRHPVTRGLEGDDPADPDWSRWFRSIEASVYAGQTILTGEGDRPLLVTNREGDGRVALFLSDHPWLWARGFEGGGPHIQLLRRLSHWLMKEPDLEEEALRIFHENGDLLVERQTMEDQAPNVDITRPDGSTETLTLTETEPGFWTATLPAPMLGLYRAEDGDHRALTNAGPDNPREFAEVRSGTGRLSPLVEETGGLIRRVEDGNSTVIPRVAPVRSGNTFSGGNWAGLNMGRATVLEGLDRYPLFNGLVGLILLVGLMALTWYREGHAR